MDMHVCHMNQSTAEDRVGGRSLGKGGTLVSICSFNGTWLLPIPSPVTVELCCS